MPQAVFKRILVPVGLSPKRPAALTVAADLAAAFAADIDVLHVLPEAPEDLESGSGLAKDVQDRVRAADTHARQVMEEMLACVKPVPVQRRLAYGSVAEEVVRLAVSARSDLVVLEASGPTGQEIARAVIRGAHCSVLMVGEETVS